MTDTALSKDSSWHLDKRVPIALILTIAIQSFAAIFWAGAINTRVAAVESRQNLMEQRQFDQAHESRIAALEARLAGIHGRLGRIEQQLDTIATLLRDGERHHDN